MKRISLAAPAVLLLGLAFNAFGQVRPGASRLRSPNGRVEVTFSLDRGGAPTYSVSFDGRAVVTPSSLGLVFKEGGALSGGMGVTGARRRAHDSWYELVAGKAGRARDNYRELTVSLEER